MGIKDAKWIMGDEICEAPVFHKWFEAYETEQAVIDICGLGWYELYINGNPATDTLYMPAVSTYENINGVMCW